MLKIKEAISMYGTEVVTDRELLQYLTKISEEKINKMFEEFYFIEDILENVYFFKEILDEEEFEKMKLLKELYKRLQKPKNNKKEQLNSPYKVAQRLSYLQNEKQEVFTLIVLDTKLQAIAIKDIFKGTLDTSIVHPREVIKELVKYNAHSFFIAHNHPSGDLEPSSADIGVTNRLEHIGDIMGIPLQDHIIVGGGNYLSFKQEGYL